MSAKTEGRWFKHRNIIWVEIFFSSQAHDTASDLKLLIISPPHFRIYLFTFYQPNIIFTTASC